MTPTKEMHSLPKPMASEGAIGLGAGMVCWKNSMAYLTLAGDREPQEWISFGV